MVNMTINLSGFARNFQAEPLKKVIAYLSNVPVRATEIKLVVKDQEEYNQLCCVCDEHGREQVIVILE